MERDPVCAKEKRHTGLFYCNVQFGEMHGNKALCKAGDGRKDEK